MKIKYLSKLKKKLKEQKEKFRICYYNPLTKKVVEEQPDGRIIQKDIKAEIGKK